jgi:hypothetical protein
LKLCAMVDWITFYMPECHSDVIGVDISESRLALCQNILNKYVLNKRHHGNESMLHPTVRIQLYHNNGIEFGKPNVESRAVSSHCREYDSEITPHLVWDSIAAVEASTLAGRRKRSNKSSRARWKRRLNEIVSQVSFITGNHPDETGPIHNISSGGLLDEVSIVGHFDRVLVDTECSTNASIKHVQLRQGMDSKGNAPKMKSNDLVRLQKQLVQRGFELLKRGGIMVYSTCSLSEDENENVVRWLLERNGSKHARLVPLDFSFINSESVISGTLPGTIRFLPNLVPASHQIGASNLFGSGFFIAKISKL